MWIFCQLLNKPLKDSQILSKFKPKIMVVAQLVEQLLPIPEVRISNPVIGKNMYWIFTVHGIEKTKIKKKRPKMAHFFKKRGKISPNLVTLRSGQRQNKFQNIFWPIDLCVQTFDPSQSSDSSSERISKHIPAPLNATQIRQDRKIADAVFFKKIILYFT